MNVLIIYSSLSGCTKRIADALYNGLPAGVEKTIVPVKEAPENLDTYDLVALGYWVDKGGPNNEMMKFIEGCSGKKVFVFATLAHPADTEYGCQTILRGCKLVEEAGNEVVGHFVGNGVLSPQVIARFKAMAETDAGNPHAMTPEKALRYEVLKDHPTEAECALASERLNERLRYLEGIAKLQG
ncbi:MAG: flavodoxin family protein [Eubacteriales bacterium]|nr:flavodoxin family protein [Eubacteriales bacterium]